MVIGGWLKAGVRSPREVHPPGMTSGMASGMASSAPTRGANCLTLREDCKETALEGPHRRDAQSCPKKGTPMGRGSKEAGKPDITIVGGLGKTEVNGQDIAKVGGQDIAIVGGQEGEPTMRRRRSCRAESTHRMRGKRKCTSPTVRRGIYGGY